MDLLGAIILGFVEGATEFIPISSTGHLIIVREILGENNLGGLAFDAILQLAATCSLLVYFWKDILKLLEVVWSSATGRLFEKKSRTMLLAVVFGTIPALVFGLLLEGYMDSVFRNVKLVAVALIVGSVLLFIADRMYKARDKRYGGRHYSLTVFRGISIGLYQCLALIPGISRSGATISGGLLSGLSKDEAVRFSFILSIPILLGAGLKKLWEVRADLGGEMGTALILGSITAFITGLIATSFLIRYLKNHNFTVFVWYRIVLALIIIIAVN